MLPSSTAGGSGGVIDATKSMEFTAQLNASSPIDAYRVIIRENTVENRIVYNSGVVDLEAPFYPTDSHGEYVPLRMTVPASSAPLRPAYVTVSSDYKSVWFGFNMAISTTSSPLASGVSLSTDGGATWSGTSENPVVGVSCKDNEIKITFTSQLIGKQNMVKIANACVAPANSYFQTSTDDFVSDLFSGYLQDSLVSLDMQSMVLAAGSTVLCGVTGNKPEYTVSRNAVISVKESGSDVDLSSRTQADNRISYTILTSSISFHVGASVKAGDYVISYTDQSLTGSTKTVSSTVKVIASGGLTYTSYVLDEKNTVISLTMNHSTANAKSSLDDLVASIALSTDGGDTWSGTTENPVVAVGFTNTEATYTKAAIYNMRIEFTHPLTGSQNIVKIPAGSIKTGSTNNEELCTPIIVVSDEGVLSSEQTEEDLTSAVANCMVNGYKYGYKWVLTLWTNYDAQSPDSESVDSYEVYFDTRDTPVVSISGPDHITTRSASWSGSYSQGQQIPMMWHRWILSGNGAVVSDTGSIYSNSTPSYEYDGLVPGVSYTITLVCVTQDGVEASSSLHFDVSYAVLDSTGVVRVYQHDDGSIEVQCANMQYITGVPSGDGFTYLSGIPIDGHTSLATDGETSIDFHSTIDADMEIGAEDTLVARLHSVCDGEKLRFVSDDGSFSFALIHRGLADGLLPNTDLYPSTSLYPDGTKWGEFVLSINGEEAVVLPTPNYSYMWYTLFITQRSMEMYGVRVKEATKWP